MDIVIDANKKPKKEKEKLHYDSHICPMCKYSWDTLIIDDFVVINYKNNDLEYREREKYFNQCMTNIRNYLYQKMKLDKHRKYKNHISNDGYIPILSVNPKTKEYRFNCYCFDCPCNKDGLCVTKFISIPKNNFHEFDGDNIIKNFCG